jgi:hypothetical protein
MKMNQVNFCLFSNFYIHEAYKHWIFIHVTNETHNNEKWYVKYLFKLEIN